MAAAQVAIGHFAKHHLLVLLPALKPAYWFLRPGSFSVEALFLLSGFLLQMSRGPGSGPFSWREHGRFLFDRLLRFYPVYVVALIAAIPVYFAQAAWLPPDRVLPAVPPLSLISEFLMVQAWTPKLIYLYHWNLPDWSVSVLWLICIVAVPVLHGVLQWRKPFFHLSIAIAIVVTFGLLRTGWGYWPLEPARVALPFCAGAFLFGFYRDRPRMPSWLPNVGALFAAGGTIACLYWYSHTRDPSFAAAGAMLGVILIVVALFYPPTWLSELLSRPPLVYLGKISYSLYLTHYVAEKFIGFALPSSKYAGAPLAARLALVALDAGIVLLAAIAAFYGVEKPCEQWRRERRRRLRGAAAA